MLMNKNTQAKREDGVVASVNLLRTMTRSVREQVKLGRGGAGGVLMCYFPWSFDR